MSKPLFFSFHNIAAVEVCSESPFVRSFFNAEYGYHRSMDPRQDLPLVRLDFELQSGHPNGYTQHNHKLLANWAYQVDLLPSRIDHRVVGNRAAVPMVHHMAVHPSLRCLSSQNGALLLHGGAVCKNGKSLVLTGRGGAGKTTTTSLILAADQGWSLHADDYVFLQSSGHSLAYLTRSHLYRSLLKWVPEVAARLTPGERTRLELLGWIRERSRERIKWPVRVGPDRLWPGTGITGQAGLAAILLLGRGDTPQTQLFPEEDKTAVVDELLEMNFGEARHFLALLKKAEVLEESWLAAWKQREKDLLTAITARTPTFRLILPKTDSPVIVRESLLPILERLVG